MTADAGERSRVAPASLPDPDGIEKAFRRRAGAFADRLFDEPIEQLATPEVVRRLGEEGLIADRWSIKGRIGRRLGVALMEELAGRGLTSTAVVVSLHTESVLAMLQQFGRPDLRPLLDAALWGREIGCVAASEPDGGSDLQSVATVAHEADDGWRIVGEKKFVTLGAQANFAVVLARLDDTKDGDRSKLATFVVPRDGYKVRTTHRLVAGSPLETSWICVDAVVPRHHLLGRPGAGLAVLNWGLTGERLAVAGLVVGACRLGLTLAVTHAHQRRQFDSELFKHQVIRLRLADLAAQLHTIASDLHHLAARPVDARRVAGLKVTAARFGERCLSECMHIFGGDGYVESRTPVGRLWRDIRLARIGGGTDELMWEIVAGGLRPDLATYHRHIHTDDVPPPIAAPASPESTIQEA